MIRLVQLEADQPIMPSATYIDQDLQSKTGQAAIDQYIADNTGRTVELTPEVVGEVSQFVDGGSAEEPAPVETRRRRSTARRSPTVACRGASSGGTKRLLGDEHVRRLMVFDQPVPAGGADHAGAAAHAQSPAGGSCEYGRHARRAPGPSR